MPEPNPKTRTHYDLLGVKPTASPQQIRQAFRELSKLYHPDTTTLPAEEATEKFQQLNEAYGILSSPDRRWTYDQQVGYSRISVMQPLEPLSRATSLPQRKEPSNLYLDPTDRPLSAGEIFALFILGLTFVACLALVVTVGLTRGDYVAELAPAPATETLAPQPTPESPRPTLAVPPSQLQAPRLEQASPQPQAKPLAPSTPPSPTWL
ncbi:MAG TPA: DnaJ domain-containing protein [Leptolyngbyaceae cyanobacterium M65_K2018_010]|nr:DnaJ domain-containing protein [Leptolyngbyaceae cyanobacterium M65_K2018_010]